MTQLSLLTTKPNCLSRCPWARPLRKAPSYVVLAVPAVLPLGLADWLRANGWRLEGYATDRGQGAVLLRGGDARELLAMMPRPVSHGSNTAGNLLPW
jgi:hypothetical protein